MSRESSAQKTARITEKPTVSAESEDLLITIKNLWRYMWPDARPDLKRRVWFAFASLLAAKAVSTFTPFIYKWIVDLLAEIDVNNVEVWLVFSIPVVLTIIYAMGAIIEVAFMQLRDSLFASVSLHAVRTLAIETFEHLHALSLRFHLQRRTGGVSRVIERGIRGIETIVRFTMLNTAPTLVEFTIVGIIFWVYFSWVYFLILVAIILLYLLFTVKASNWRVKIRRDMNDSDTDANSKAIDSLLNYETVKYFNNEEMETKRYDRSMARYEKAATRMWISLGWLNLGQGFIFWSGAGLCLSLSASAIVRGEQTVGDFVLIFAYLMQLYRPLSFMGFVYREIRQGLADIEQMFLLLDKNPEIVDAPNAQPIEIKGGHIKFDNVHFSYEEERKILQGVSFEVKPGETIAVVGPSGAGKSTISRLMYRFYDVSEGAIEIDGQNIAQVQQLSLREKIGMVPQDTVLFNDTLAYNVEYGRPGATREEIETACDMAQIRGFIEKTPQGFDTEVGERGLKLSGGEKQRVAVARTILKAPPILILDEATSALDTQTEREIQSALDEVSSGRTTLVIAHRLSTVVNADEIIVLNDGVIEERGRHEDLLTNNGLYAEMWNRQREVDEARQVLQEKQKASIGMIKPTPVEES